MIRFWQIAWLLALLVTGCAGETTDPNAGKSPVPPASVQIEAEYPFCEDGHLDRFVMDYQGNQSGVLFYIICANGDTLTHHEWTTTTLLPDSLAQLPEGSQREAAVLQQMRSLVINNPTHTLSDEWPGGDPISAPARELLAQQGAQRVFAVRLASGKTQLFAWSPTLQSAIQLL